jgi:tellurium resistance protein TerD
LTKTNPAIKKFKVGLGWNPNAAVGGTFDVDVSAFILNEAGKRVSDAHFVFFNNLKSPNDFVTHTGDNRDGQGEGDDESLIVDFSKVGADEKAVMFVVTIHEAAQKNQNFGQITGSYIRICDEATGAEIMKYDLNEDYSVETAMIFGKLYSKDGEWKFEAVGTGMKGGLQDYLSQF